MEHSKFFSDEWNTLCFERRDLLRNFLPQTEHTNLPSCLWIWDMWYFKLFLYLKSLSHNGHLCCAKSEWVSLCLDRLLLFWNNFSHKEHLKRFSPVWTLLWSLRIVALLNVLSQIKQQCTFLFLVFLPTLSKLDLLRGFDILVFRANEPLQLFGKE